VNITRKLKNIETKVYTHTDIECFSASSNDTV